MNSNKEEQTYYEKIYLSSGEVPEESGMYHTGLGMLLWDKKYQSFFTTPEVFGKIVEPEYWLKPCVPSNKEEAVAFAEWIKKEEYIKDNHTANCEVVKWRKGYVSYTTSELYDKFKEKGEQ